MTFEKQQCKCHHYRTMACQNHLSSAVYGRNSPRDWVSVGREAAVTLCKPEIIKGQKNLRSLKTGRVKVRLWCMHTWVYPCANLRSRLSCIPGMCRFKLLLRRSYEVITWYRSWDYDAPETTITREKTLREKIHNKFMWRGVADPYLSYSVIKRSLWKACVSSPQFCTSQW